jgi:hypothetical protein
MTDWADIEQLSIEDDEAVFEPASSHDIAGRLAAPVNGRCPHGFAVGSGLCRVRGCAAHGEAEKVRTCLTCRRPYTEPSHGPGRRCAECARAARRHRGSL